MDVRMHAADRGVLVGANGTGKSTLANYVLTEFRKEYPDARIVVLDTKPRWRATRLVDGTSTRKLYRPLAKGDTIPDSVSMSRMQDWALAWDRDANPTQTVVVQRLDGTMADNVRYQVAFLEKVFKTQHAERPTLVYIDEGMDFFTANSGARGGTDIVQRCYRAGRERNLATLTGVQRPVAINAQILTETNWAALFRINFANDVKRMFDMGWPQHELPPTYEEYDRIGPGLFKLWLQGSREAPLCRIKINGRKAA